MGLDVNTLVYSGAAIVCGFQALMLAVLARLYAINARLLPDDQRIRRFTSVFSLEAGLVAGLLLILGGLAASAYAVGFWRTAAFGPLDPQVSLRIVAPSATALIVGLQLVFSSFFLGILGLERR